LLPLSWLYGLVIACRNKAFDWGLMRVSDAGVPVISVGNLTAGGTGKTPLVEYIVETCLAKKRKVAVVSRGYKRDSSGVVMVSDGGGVRVDAGRAGDEPMQMARKYPGVVVVVGERRAEAARMALASGKTDLMVMDDGFQHRSLRRDLDILVLDSRKDAFLTPMIPAGERREPTSAVRRARLLAFSRADQDTGWWKDHPLVMSMPAIHYRYRVDRMMRVFPDREQAAGDWRERQFFAFSGIGDHEDFLRQLRGMQARLVGDLRFPDHRKYSPRDVTKIVTGARKKGADALLTTEKDVVRLSGRVAGFEEILGHFPLYYAGITVDVTQGREVLQAMIDRCVGGSAVQ